MKRQRRTIQADTEIRSRDLGGIAGYAIGVLYMATPFVFVPGNIQNATTLPFPVAYECVEGVTLPQLLSGAETVGDALIAAATRLERRGVRAIVGACGSFARFQTLLTNAVRIPVFSSILTQVPWLIRSLPADQRVLVLFADRRSFTPAMRSECGITDLRRIVISDCMAIPEFCAMLARPYTLQHAALERALVRHVKREMVEHKNIGLIVLQCSELPPYAAAIQDAVSSAVVDVVTLATWAHEVVTRRPYIRRI
ncbi:MAG TPA: aspartate/glutamate racemase family protein [Steroidobacteraceae bacterium]|nr:aspartate/glutamate racemase family protein [Steroidobacteraceae bacterium]